MSSMKKEKVFATVVALMMIAGSFAAAVGFGIGGLSDNYDDGSANGNFLQDIILSDNALIDEIPATAIKLTSSKSLNIGEKAFFNFTVTPTNTTDVATATSSDEDIVTAFIEWGTLKQLHMEAHSAGVATITIKLNDDVSAICTVTVDTPSYEVEDGFRISVDIDVPVYLEFGFSAEDTVGYESDDENVATVNGEGLVTPKTVGECKITAAVGETSVSCDISVIDDGNFVLIKSTNGTKFTLTDDSDKAFIIAKPGKTFPVPDGDWKLKVEGKDPKDAARIMSFGELEVELSEGNRELNVVAGTVKSSNANWKNGTDYGVEVTFGDRTPVILGEIDGNNATRIIVPYGSTIFYKLSPLANRIDEGYLPSMGSNTNTGFVSVNVRINIGYDFEVTVPKDADVFVGFKFNHFIPYLEFEPEGSPVVDEKRFTATYTYHLAGGTEYNYRIGGDDYVTYATNFRMTEANMSLSISLDDLCYGSDVYGKTTIVRDLSGVQSSFGVADILLNINEEGHLLMKQGDEHILISTKVFQAQHGVTANYFFEPDKHFTVLGLDGNASNAVSIEFDPTIGHHVISADSNGTAIVLVTYDSIILGSSATSGNTADSFFSALWPENTGVFVITVGDDKPDFETGMKVNESYNERLNKLAGAYVDSELDVFYYLEHTGGFKYTFEPESGSTVSVLNPVIGERVIEEFVNGSAKDNGDGTFTVTLTEGRNIVSITNGGQTKYQVMTAKPVTYTLENAAGPGIPIKYGDDVIVTIGNLYQPAIKLAAVYNMGCALMYESEIGTIGKPYTGFGNYGFAGMNSFTVTIPEDWNKDTFTLTRGIINEGGFGDNYGNHRNMDPYAGLPPNFTALTRNAYFGVLPEIVIEGITEAEAFEVSFDVSVENADIVVTENGKVVESVNGAYELSYGSYDYIVTADGYVIKMGSFSVTGEVNDQTITVDMGAQSPGPYWDGVAREKPVMWNGTYLVYKASELAWFSANKPAKGTNILLCQDINLNYKPWTPIDLGNGVYFNGNGHMVSGVYNDPSSNYAGLFSVANNGTVIANLSTDGIMFSKNFAGGIVSSITNSEVKNCASFATIISDKRAGGIVGLSVNSKIHGCTFEGTVEGENAGGICGGGYITEVSYCANKGDVDGINAAGIMGGSSNAAYNGKTYVYASYNLGNITGTAVSGIAMDAAIVEGCYTTGLLTCSDVSKSAYICSGCVIQTCYYLENTGTEGIDKSGTQRTAANMGNMAFTKRFFESTDYAIGTAPEYRVFNRPLTVTYTSFTGDTVIEVTQNSAAGFNNLGAPNNARMGMFGYVFKGWSDDPLATASMTPYERITTDVTLFPVYGASTDEQEYSLSIGFDLDGEQLTVEVTVGMGGKNFENIDNPVICVWTEYSDHTFMHVYSDIILNRGVGSSVLEFSYTDAPVKVYALIYDGMPDLDGGSIAYGSTMQEVNVKN